MDVSIYSAASAMNATEQWQDLIAANLSMAGVPGAHARAMSFESMQAGQATVAGQPLVMPNSRITTDFTGGEMRRTNNDMDFGLIGPGFFTVQMPDGSKGYTRDGEFAVDKQGQLVTKTGFPVISDSGALRADPTNKAPLTISKDGVVSQGSVEKGKLAIVEFSKPQTLTPEGGGIYSNPNEELMPPQPGSNTQLQQGSIENSNVSPTLAMATMITAMRMFESNEKSMQMGSDRMSKAITELSNPN